MTEVGYIGERHGRPQGSSPRSTTAPTSTMTTISSLHGTIIEEQWLYFSNLTIPSFKSDTVFTTGFNIFNDAFKEQPHV